MSDCPQLPKEIIDAAKNQRLVLFLGAGLSTSAGLIDWPTLRNQLIERARPAAGSDVEGFRTSLRAEPNNYKCFGSIKRNDLETYNEVLADAFEPNEPTKQKFKGLFDALMTLKPQSIVTLNVDCLLVDHNPFGHLKARRMGDCWPWEINDQRLFFFHGYVDHRGGPTNGWVFDDQDLAERYKQPDTAKFLYGLFAGFYTILFVGFSFSDQALLDFAAIPPQTQKEIAQNKRPHFHYALLPSSAAPSISTAQSLGMKPLIYKHLPDSATPYINFENTLKEWAATMSPKPDVFSAVQETPEEGPSANV